MRFRTSTLPFIACLLAFVSGPGCDDSDDLECGDGTEELMGQCVVADTDALTDGSTGTDADGASGKQGDDRTDSGSGDDDDDGDLPGGSDGADDAGECVGQPWDCAAFEDDETCLGQNGCYPVLSCVGVEEDCVNYEYLSPECEAAPHCYSDTMVVGTTTLPGCWPYDVSCEEAIPEFEPCEAFGGTCHTGNTCEGDPDPCEYESSQPDCEALAGCFWKAE